MDIKFENWGPSLGIYRRIFLSFGWGIFGHVMRLIKTNRAQTNTFDGL